MCSEELEVSFSCSQKRTKVTKMGEAWPGIVHLINGCEMNVYRAREVVGGGGMF